jgi:hypothetical protein
MSKKTYKNPGKNSAYSCFKLGDFLKDEKLLIYFLSKPGGYFLSSWATE